MGEFRYDVTEINEILGSWLPEVKGLQTTVGKAMNEAMENGGKRVRPIIMYETCRMFAEACGEEKEAWISDIAPFMAAIEMIHTFSLIHDDLPCMDNDTLRRGKPTTWYTYGEAMGTLAGDGLMLEALFVAGKSAAESSNPSVSARAMEILGEKSGSRGMLGGQSVDVEMTGKPIGSDEKNQKTTYVTLYGIENAEKEVKRLSEEAELLLQEMPGDHTALRELIRMMIGRRS